MYPLRLLCCARSISRALARHRAREAFLHVLPLIWDWTPHPGLASLPEPTRPMLHVPWGCHTGAGPHTQAALLPAARSHGGGSSSAAPGLDKPCWGAGRGGDARRARVDRHRVHGDGRRPRAEGDPKAFKLKVCTCVHRLMRCGSATVTCHFPAHTAGAGHIRPLQDKKIAN